MVAILVLKCGLVILWVSVLLAQTGCQTTGDRLGPAVVPAPASASTGSAATTPEPRQASSLPAVRQLLTQARQDSDRERWAQAQQALEQALRLSPRDPEIFLLWGDLHRARGDASGARNMYQRALALSPPDSRPARQATRRLEDQTWP
jgi:tetratricopeptide (TPR) repeat protein